MRKLSTIAGLLTFCTLAAAAPVDARVEHSLRYTKTQSYNGALRFLRVDSGYNVLEKDIESGYLLFEYPSNGTESTHGSIEVIEREKSVALIVQLPQMPAYHERMLASGLLKKLRADYGAPPKAKKPKADEPKNEPEAPKEEDRLPGPPIQKAP